MAETVSLSINTPIDTSEAKIVKWDLNDMGTVDQTVHGCDGIIGPNLIGLHNLYEAARKHGHLRVLFANSNHVVGYCRHDEQLDASASHQPDGWFGISKSYGRQWR